MIALVYGLHCYNPGPAAEHRTAVVSVQERDGCPSRRGLYRTTGIRWDFGFARRDIRPRSGRRPDGGRGRAEEPGEEARGSVPGGWGLAARDRCCEGGGPVGPGDFGEGSEPGSAAFPGPRAVEPASGGRAGSLGSSGPAGPAASAGEAGRVWVGASPDDGEDRAGSGAGRGMDSGSGSGSDSGPGSVRDRLPVGASADEAAMAPGREPVGAEAGGAVEGGASGAVKGEVRGWDQESGGAAEGAEAAWGGAPGGEPMREKAWASWAGAPAPAGGEAAGGRAVGGPESGESGASASGTGCASAWGADPVPGGSWWASGIPGAWVRGRRGSASSEGRIP